MLESALQSDSRHRVLKREPYPSKTWEVLYFSILIHGKNPWDFSMSIPIPTCCMIYWGHLGCPEADVSRGSSPPVGSRKCTYAWPIISAPNFSRKTQSLGQDWNNPNNPWLRLGMASDSGFTRWSHLKFSSYKYLHRWIIYPSIRSIRSANEFYPQILPPFHPHPRHPPFFMVTWGGPGDLSAPSTARLHNFFPCDLPGISHRHGHTGCRFAFCVRLLRIWEPRDGAFFWSDGTKCANGIPWNPAFDGWNWMKLYHRDVHRRDG